MFTKIISELPILKQYYKLKYLAYHDSLTKLLNRTWLYENINNMKNKYKYVYFIDINDLKKYNINGHTFGDKQIILIVGEIQKQINLKDIFIRYAGDEFILFSNALHPIKTNTLYSVGGSHISSHIHINDTINIANLNMIVNKRIYKKTLCTT